MPQLIGGVANWREQLRINNHRTRFVMLTFVLIYAALGLLVDSLMVMQTYHVPFETALNALFSFQVMPIATPVMGIVAIIAILITFSLHDKIMLMGTEYVEITAETPDTTAKQLYNIVEELKIAAGLNYMPKIYIIDAPYLNAFASGYSESSAMVAITRGLLEKLNRSELQAVMAHELSHIRHLDIKLTLMVTVLSNLMLIVMDILFRSLIYGGYRSHRNDDDRKDSNRLVIVIVILRFLLPIITVLLTLYLSRTREYMADAGAVELMRDNEPLAKALLKINADYQANSEAYQALSAATPHENLRTEAYIFDPTRAGLQGGAALSSLFSTHPSLEQRLKALGFQLK